MAAGEPDPLVLEEAVHLISANPAVFKVMLRNAMFHRVTLAAREDYDAFDRLAAKDGWNGLGVHRNINVGREADEDTTADIQVGTEYIVCAQKGLRMRKKPDIRGEYMQMLPDGAVITVLEERAGWFKTTYKGYTGWVSAEYCCKATGND